MRYKKLVYPHDDNGNNCPPDFEIKNYFNTDSEYYIDELIKNKAYYPCTKCGDICKALKDVRGDCYHSQPQNVYALDGDLVYCGNIFDCGNIDCHNETKQHCSVTRCEKICEGYDSVETFKANWKKIQKTVGVSSSEYFMNKAALTVWSGIKDSAESSNASDRKNLVGPMTFTTSRHPNSVTRTKLSLKPGSMNPGGVGTDVKNNSYARYLAIKKGKKILRAEHQFDNQKIVKQNIVSGYYIDDKCCFGVNPPVIDTTNLTSPPLIIKTGDMNLGFITASEPVQWSIDDENVS